MPLNRSAVLAVPSDAPAAAKFLRFDDPASISGTTLPVQQLTDRDMAAIAVHVREFPELRRRRRSLP